MVMFHSFLYVYQRVLLFSCRPGCALMMHWSWSLPHIHRTKTHRRAGHRELDHLGFVSLIRKKRSWLLSPEVSFNNPATAPRCWTRLSSNDLRHVQAPSVSFHWTTCDRDCPQTQEVGQGKLEARRTGWTSKYRINQPPSDTYFFLPVLQCPDPCGVDSIWIYGLTTKSYFCDFEHVGTSRSTIVQSL